MQTRNAFTAELAADITAKASKLTFTMIKSLVPVERRGDAFRAYAYFRWLDDLLDGDVLNAHERTAFFNSQKDLLRESLQGNPPINLTADEWLLVDLTKSPLAQDPGLQIYLNKMMAVMEFDLNRRGRRINREELDWYSRCLATAVTEAVYTFIGDSCGSPRIPDRYLAADAAHIVHMLRDMVEDLEAGYINIPFEIIGSGPIDRSVLKSASVRTWVQERTKAARKYFERGDAYLASVENPNCRLASAWYAARFLGVLDAIERDGYILRRDYSDCNGNRALFRMAWSGLHVLMTIRGQHPEAISLPKGNRVPAIKPVLGLPNKHEETIVQ